MPRIRFIRREINHCIIAENAGFNKVGAFFAPKLILIFIKMFKLRQLGIFYAFFVCFERPFFVPLKN